MNTNKEVLLVLVPEYADWEPAILAAGLRRGFGMWKPRYTVKTVAPTSGPVCSIGGFHTIPDYTFESVPDDFAAIVLVGGTDWFGDVAQEVLPLAKKAVSHNALLAGICDGSMFLGVNGFLNDVDHTSNSLEVLKSRAGSAYTGEARYKADRQSVHDGKIVTANGVGFIEFARDIFSALEVAPREVIDEVYESFKSGFFPTMKPEKQ